MTNLNQLSRNGLKLLANGLCNKLNVENKETKWALTNLAATNNRPDITGNGN